MRRHAGTHSPPWLPSDRFWSTGRLIPSHELASQNQCSACHNELFVRVTDTACRKCHERVRDHVPRPLPQRDTHTATPRCATCHREHDTDAAHFVPRADGLCTNCHREPQTPIGRPSVQKATEFAKDSHPDFTVRLLRPAKPHDVGGTGEWQESLGPIGTAREQSNLKFSHRQHLDPTKVTRIAGSAPLECGDCHTLSGDGAHFVPVTMRSDCLVCHALEFARGRQLPHGEPEEAVAILQDFYVRSYSEPVSSVPQSLRRLPDRGPAPAPFACNEKPYDCGMRRARVEVEDQFSRRGCVSCHVVTDTAESALLHRFRVAAVRLQAAYFPTARFDHRSHAVQGKLTGDGACLSCHHADRSEQSTDLLIPSIAKCLECHSSRAAADRVALPCASCHAYHPRSTGLSARAGTP